MFLINKTYHFIACLLCARHCAENTGVTLFNLCACVLLLSHLTDRQIEGINYSAKVMWQSWKSNQGQSDFRACYETPYYSIFHVFFFFLALVIL